MHTKADQGRHELPPTFALVLLFSTMLKCWSLVRFEPVHVCATWPPLLLCTHRLIKSGMSFTNFYSAPLCAMGRAEFLTGRSWTRTGTLFNG